MTIFSRVPFARIALTVLMVAVGGNQAVAKKKHRPDDVILIHNVQELQGIQNNLSGNYRLANDIDASGFAFTPIGASDTGFAGVLDGNGYAIRNVNVSTSVECYAAGEQCFGLFAYISGTVENLRLDNVQIAAATSGNYAVVGTLSGGTGGAIRNVTSTGAIVVTGGAGEVDTGGLVGFSSGGVENTTSATSVTASDSHLQNVYAGGLIGIACCYKGGGGNLVRLSSASGPIIVNGSGTQGAVGGLIGANGSLLSLSYALGAVSGSLRSGIVPFGVGGLLGWNAWDAVIDHVFATGSVQGNANVGGLIGWIQDGGVQQSFALGSVSGGKSAFAGALVGWAGDYPGSYASVRQSYAVGHVRTGAGGLVGGIVGKLDQGSNLSATYWDLNSTGISDPGKGCGNVPNCSGVVGLHTKDFKGKIPGGLNTPDWMQINFPFRSDYPKLWAPSFPITTFPLSGYTPYSIPIVSVFDHSQQDSPNSGIGRLYACDQVVRAFEGSTGKLQYGSDAPQCKQPGYKQQSGKNFVLGGVNYVGLPAKYLEYDGHPGYDLAASLQTPVYAAVAGTVFYPWRAVGSGSNNDTYCRFHTLAQIPDIAPTYRLYYLHLSTHPAKKGQTNPDCSSSKDTDGQTVDFTAQANCYTDLNGNPINPTTLPLPEGTHANAGCEIALSGDAGVPGSPHLHFEVQQMVRADGFPGNKDNMKYFACYDERKSYKQGLPGVDPYCLPADPYGYVADDTQCSGDASSWTGDIWQCLTGIPSRRFWAQ